MIIYCFVNVIFEKVKVTKLDSNYRTCTRKKGNSISTVFTGECFDDHL